ncbi:MAG: tetratricopeptide repeat protein [Gemmatimonadetes bacterium]|nr:tetratricopeptide repeat protein [Gemmatimonadota bacterium]
MIRGRAVWVALLAGWTAGCVYLNSIYNARQRFSDGERARVEGRSDEARQAYADAARKASASFRRDPEGPWADDALYILGRAHFREGDQARAIGALEAALLRADDPDVRRGAQLYLGAALTEIGDRRRARALLDSAIVELQTHDLVGEAHYWRGRLHLAEGQVDQGLFDLARAETSDPALRIPVLFQRLAHGIEADDTIAASRAAAGLLSDTRAGILSDSIAALVGRASGRWGPSVAAALLAPVRTGDWPPGPRDRLLLQRIGLLIEAGDTLAVESEAGWAMQGSTAGAEEARLVVARIRLARAEEVMELEAVRRILLPGGGLPPVAALTADIRRVESLEEWGSSEDPVAFFVAAELARDRLGSPRLARGLFLRFASEAPDNPWAGKAILAALATTPDPRSDAALRAGLEARRGDPYVAQASGRTSATTAPLGELETQLHQIVSEWMARADEEALRRDLFLRGADTSAVAGSGAPS